MPVEDVHVVLETGAAQQLVDLTGEGLVATSKQVDHVAAADHAHHRSLRDDRQALDRRVGHQLHRLGEVALRADGEGEGRHHVLDPTRRRGRRLVRDQVGALVVPDGVLEEVGLADHAEQAPVERDHGHGGDLVPVEQPQPLLDRGIGGHRHRR